MSVAETATADQQPSSQPAGKRWMLFATIVLALGAGGGAAWWYFGKTAPVDVARSERPAATSPSFYYTLADNLVVNFRGRGNARYLQVGIEVMTRDPNGVAALQAHAPVIRNNLIMLLSDQSQEDLATREGKEALRGAALAEVQTAMESLHGSSVAESLYFTTLVMQ